MYILDPAFLRYTPQLVLAFLTMLKILSRTQVLLKTIIGAYNEGKPWILGRANEVSYHAISRRINTKTKTQLDISLNPKP